MYDELIKRLRGRANLVREYNESGKLFDDAADAIEELQATVDGLTAQTNMVIEETEGRSVIKFEPKWIPVTERLPEDRVPVLATYIGFCTGEKSSDLLAVRFEGMWCYWDGDPCSYDECKVKITHWMPLPKTPQPPKEEC